MSNDSPKKWPAVVRLETPNRQHRILKRRLKEAQAEFERKADHWLNRADEHRQFGGMSLAYGDASRVLQNILKEIEDEQS